MQYQRQSEYYMQEAEWLNDKYQPSFEEHEELCTMSTGLPMLNLMALTGYDGAVATQELFDWISSRAPPNDVVRACAAIGRLLNDISSYKVCMSYITHDRRRTSPANFDLIARFHVHTAGKEQEGHD
jgi:hypothetical protein